MKFEKVGVGKKLCESNHKVSTPNKKKMCVSEDLKKRMKLYEAKRRATIKEDTTGKDEDRFVLYFPHVEPKIVSKDRAINFLETELGFFKKYSGAGLAGRGYAIYCLESVDAEDGHSWEGRYSSKDFLKTLTESKQVSEAFAKQINLTDIAVQVAGMLDQEELGDKWIEFNYGEERTLMGSNEKHIPFRAVGEYETKSGYMRTSNGRIDVVIRNGSEAKCDSVDEIARFIEGQFHYQGIKNEALNINYGKRPEPSPEKKKLLALLDDLTFYIDRDNEELIDRTLTKMVNFRKGITEDVKADSKGYAGITKEFLDTIPNSEDFEQYGKYADLDSAREEIPSAPETPEDTGIAGILNNLIIDEWEAIDGYNSAIVTLTDLGKYDEVDVLKDIVNEENIHVGQLQKVLELVSPNAASIGEGEAEAAEQLNNNKGEISNE